MTNHWPVLVAVLMVAGAAYFGYSMQCDYEQKAKVTPTIRTLPPKYLGTAKITEFAVAQPQQPLMPVAAAQVAPEVRANAFAPAPIQPAMPGRAAVPVPGDLNTILNNLRTALTQRFGVAPIATPVGFAVAVDGGRIEVDAQPSWSISIYNDNKFQPSIQSENFVAMLNLTAANLECDLTSPANTTADGKVTRRPVSKLGRISIVTDPAMNNSTTIRPIIRKLNAAAANANAGNPVNPPVAPIAALPMPPQPVKVIKPVAPPKAVPPPADPVKPPPAADQF